MSSSSFDGQAICLVFTVNSEAQYTKTGATSGAGTAYPSKSTCVHSLFLVRFVLLHLNFYRYVLEIVVCSFVLFLLAIVLSVLLRYTDSD